MKPPFISTLNHVGKIAYRDARVIVGGKLVDVTVWAVPGSFGEKAHLSTFEQMDINSHAHAGGPMLQKLPDHWGAEERLRGIAKGLPKGDAQALATADELEEDARYVDRFLWRGDWKVATLVWHDEISVVGDEVDENVTDAGDIDPGK